MTLLSAKDRLDLLLLQRSLFKPLQSHSASSFWSLASETDKAYRNVNRILVWACTALEAIQSGLSSRNRERIAAVRTDWDRLAIKSLGGTGENK